MILSGVTPRSARTLAIPLASTPQLGATLVSQRRWTFILQTVRRHGEETSNVHDLKRYLVGFFFFSPIVKVIHVHLIEFGKCRKTKREKQKSPTISSHRTKTASFKTPYRHNHCLWINITFYFLLGNRTQTIREFNPFIWRKFIWILSTNGLHMYSVLYYFAKMWEYYQVRSAHSTAYWDAHLNMRTLNEVTSKVPFKSKIQFQRNKSHAWESFFAHII